ncbi:MAG TPA: class I SAM-dependent methyltransferase [Acidothermaceae bacterium]
MSTSSSAGDSTSAGTGPGAITPDGCAVDLYALVPARDEPAIIDAASPPNASILELGCGAGRVTHPLIALGHSVVAVDESPEMLAHVHGARTVVSRIEDLDLSLRFDVVVLSSHLVNVPNDDQRRAFLATCARHVLETGCVVIQRHPVSWFDTLAPSRRSRPAGDGVEPITFVLDGISRPAPDLVAATAEYLVGDRRWTQTFVARRLDDAQLNTALAQVGLRLDDAYLSDDGSWLRARPIALMGAGGG